MRSLEFFLKFISFKMIDLTIMTEKSDNIKNLKVYI